MSYTLIHNNIVYNLSYRLHTKRITHNAVYTIFYSMLLV